MCSTSTADASSRTAVFKRRANPRQQHDHAAPARPRGTAAATPITIGIFTAISARGLQADAALRPQRRYETHNFTPLAVPECHRRPDQRLCARPRYGHLSDDELDHRHRPHADRRLEVLQLWRLFLGPDQNRQAVARLRSASTRRNTIRNTPILPCCFRPAAVRQPRPDQPSALHGAVGRVGLRAA